MKILSKGDTTVRQIMVDSCYMDAGIDEIKSNACDVLQRDILDLLWNSLPFQDLVVLNRDKYESFEAEMVPELFDSIVEQITNFSVEFFELLDEVDSHKEVTLIRLKEAIDDRTRALIQEAQRNQKDQQQAVITHHVEVTQVEQGGHPGNQSTPAVEDLPPEQI